MNAKRLLKLAEFLKTVPRKRFNYGHVVGSDWQGAADLSCGATACAMGWATTMPYFRKLGLKLGKDHECLIKNTTINYYLNAAVHIFEIDFDEADYLFTPDSNWGPGWRATPKQVARHIEKFVKSNGFCDYGR